MSKGRQELENEKKLRKKNQKLYADKINELKETLKEMKGTLSDATALSRYSDLAWENRTPC